MATSKVASLWYVTYSIQSALKSWVQNWSFTCMFSNNFIQGPCLDFGSDSSSNFYFHLKKSRSYCTRKFNARQNFAKIDKFLHCHKLWYTTISGILSWKHSLDEGSPLVTKWNWKAFQPYSWLANNLPFNFP